MFENNNVLKTKFAKRKASLTHTHSASLTPIHPSISNPTGHMENFGRHYLKDHL